MLLLLRAPLNLILHPFQAMYFKLCNATSGSLLITLNLYLLITHISTIVIVYPKSHYQNNSTFQITWITPFVYLPIKLKFLILVVILFSSSLSKSLMPSYSMAPKRNHNTQEHFITQYFMNSYPIVLSFVCSVFIIKGFSNAPHRYSITGLLACDQPLELYYLVYIASQSFFNTEQMAATVWQL